MFSSSILEIIIGIVFIYVLLSLLATTVNELIQTFLFSARGRDLEKAIVAMLSDRKPAEESPVKGNNPDKNAGRNNDQNTAKVDLAEKFYTHPLIEKLAKQGGNNKPSYISRTTFSKVLIDLLSIPDKAYSTVNEIKAEVEKLPVENKTRAVLLSLIKDAGDDMTALRMSFEDWYDEMMDRASGWYKRRVQRALLIIGLLISAFINADTFNIVHTLSSNPDARAKIVKQAEAFRDKQLNANSQLISQRNSLKTDSLNLIATGDSTLIRQNVNKLNLVSDSIYSIENQINQLRQQINYLQQEEIAEATSILGMGWDHPTIPPWDNSNFISFIKSLGKKLLYILFRLPGWIITTLAITLGAPFWFDILNKVINIRNVGLKPEEKKNTSTTQYTSSGQPVG